MLKPILRKPILREPIRPTIKKLPIRPTIKKLYNRFYNSYPLIIHCPNIKNSLIAFPDLNFLKYFLTPKVKFGLYNTNYTILFCNTYNSNSILQQSLDCWSIPAVQLGLGTIFPPDAGPKIYC